MLIMEEELNTRLYTESATGLFCFQNGGKIVDYKTILQARDLEIADGINNTLNSCKESF